MSDKTNSSAPVSETCTKDGGICGIGGYCFACHQFPITTQPPASPAPASAQEGQGGLTDNLDDERVLFEARYRDLFARGKLVGPIKMMFSRSPAGNYEHMYTGAYWHGWRERAILARHTAPTVGSVPEADRKMIVRAIIGLRDGWATRKDADDALAALAAAPREQAASRAAVPEDDRWTILHNGKSVSADTLTGCMAAARQLRTPEEAARASENLAAAIAADSAEEQAERAAARNAVLDEVAAAFRAHQRNWNVAAAQFVEAVKAAPVAQEGKAVDGVPCTVEAQEVLADVFTSSERPDKMTVKLNAASHSVTVTYEDIDEQWFAELVASLPRGSLHNGTVKVYGATKPSC